MHAFVLYPYCGSELSQEGFYRHGYKLFFYCDIYTLCSKQKDIEQV